MKILRFDDDKIGVLKGGDRVVDVSECISYRVEKGPERVIEEIIEKFDTYRGKFEGLVARNAGVPLGSVKLQAPIPRPGKCLAAYVNYLDKPERTIESLPIDFFYKNPVLLGPEGTVELLDIPEVTLFHAEAEFAYVIGKEARNVKEEDGMNYVFGYIPFFDISARGLTRNTMFIAKGQATYGPCGPWITTKDEIPDPYNLSVKSWISGQLRQNYNTKDMAHKIAEQVAWLSRFAGLQPGDVIATGTHHEGLYPVNGGDVLEIEIENLGKARFNVKGYGPRKEGPHAGPPKASQPVSRV